MAVAAGKAKKPYVITPHGLSIADGRRRIGLKMRLAWLLRDRRLVRAATFIAAVNEYEQQQLLRAEAHSDVRILPYGLNFVEYAMAESLADSEPRASARADSPVSSSGNPSSAIPNHDVRNGGIPRREREEAAETTLPPCQGGTKGGRVPGENAIPSRDRQEATSNAPSRQILVLGDITPDSGCVALLKCLAELGPDAEGWHVVLAGTIPEKWKSALQLAVRRKGAEERVSFADAADISAQRDLLARSALLVVPSPVVRAPIAATQALAAGVPVLCTAPAAPPEMNAHVHLCGLDRTALREKLREILRKSDQTLIQSAAYARTHAATALDWSTLTGRFIEAYESAL